MQSRATMTLWLFLALLCASQSDASLAQPSFSEAIADLAAQKSSAEQAVGLLKKYGSDQIRIRTLYADAKAGIDGVIAQVQLDLVSSRKVDASAQFLSRTEKAKEKSVTFMKFAETELEKAAPKGSKSPLTALLSSPDKIITAIVDGGLSIWKAIRGAGQDDRDQMLSAVSQIRWRPFAEIPVAY